MGMFFARAFRYPGRGRQPLIESTTSSIALAHLIRSASLHSECCSESDMGIPSASTPIGTQMIGYPALSAGPHFGLEDSYQLALRFAGLRLWSRKAAGHYTARTSLRFVEGLHQCLLHDTSSWCMPKLQNTSHLLHLSMQSNRQRYPVRLLGQSVRLPRSWYLPGPWGRQDVDHCGHLHFPHCPCCIQLRPLLSSLLYRGALQDIR